MGRIPGGPKGMPRQSAMADVDFYGRPGRGKRMLFNAPAEGSFYDGIVDHDDLETRARAAEQNAAASKAREAARDFQAESADKSVRFKLHKAGLVEGAPGWNAAYDRGMLGWMREARRYHWDVPHTGFHGVQGVRKVSNPDDRLPVRSYTSGPARYVKPCPGRVTPEIGKSKLRATDGLTPAYRTTVDDRRAADLRRLPTDLAEAMTRLDACKRIGKKVKSGDFG